MFNLSSFCSESIETDNYFFKDQYTCDEKLNYNYNKKNIYIGEL